jgi:hypothetical protein
MNCLCRSNADAVDSIGKANPGADTWRDRENRRALGLWHSERPLIGKSLGFNEVMVGLEESPQIFQHLLFNAVERRLTTLGFTRKGAGFVNYSKPSLLASIPALAAADGRIGIYPKTLLDIDA